MPEFVMPAPLLSGYGLEASDCTVRTDMESGPARVRRRSSAAPDTVALKYLFTAAEMAGFRAWWDSTWEHGAAWAAIPVADGRSAGAVVKECRPNPAKFSAEPMGNAQWLVSLTVEVRNA